jgi:hypothetical protein
MHFGFAGHFFHQIFLLQILQNLELPMQARNFARRQTGLYYLKFAKVFASRVVMSI